jgi:hypothetical protein
MNVLYSLFVRYSWEGVRESSAPIVYHHESTSHQHHGGLKARSGKISQCQNGTWTIKMMQAPVSSTATTAALDTLQEVGQRQTESLREHGRNHGEFADPPWEEIRLPLN